jgi:teichuronic acid biosynthesis glycosyltransferase TuaG
MESLVSIIMPAYNAGKYVGDSIRSVLAQTCGGFELIVVDDGSTDDTAGVVREIASADARVRYIRRENGGQGKARNTGIENSRGALVAFLDADDLWEPDKLGRQLRVLEETGCDIVFGGGFIFVGDDTADESRAFPTVEGKFDGAQMFDVLIDENVIPILSALVRKEALGGARPFVEERPFQNCEDYDLWLTLAERGKTFYGTGEKLVRYRRHPASTTHRESRALLPMVAVLRRHYRPEGARGAKMKQRIRWLYRAAVAALLKETQVDEARLCMREFAAWDRGGLVTQCQRILLGVSPAGFDAVSRECLYRAEWHARKIVGKFSSRRPSPQD